MNRVETFQLDVWRGDWGLPSIDIHCLQILAYSKFSGVPLKINPTNNPFRTPNGHLPVFRNGKDIALDSNHDIINFFRKRNYTSDCSLSSTQCAELVAYECMLKEALYPAMQFVWWIDQKNFTELMRPWYAKAIPFPLNFYYPSKYAKHAQEMVESLYPIEEATNVIETNVYSKAQKCLTLLSSRLDESDFFFGMHPTYLDALVYSYLAPLLKAPLPNPALQNHLKACTNLVAFVTRITQRYFEKDYQEYEKIKTKESEKLQRRNSDSELPNKRKNQIIAGIIATLAMVTYALANGIVEVRINDEDDDEDLYTQSG